METIKSQVLHDLEECINEAKSEGKGYLIRMDIPGFGYDHTYARTYLNYPAKIVSRYCYDHDLYWGSAAIAGIYGEDVHGNTGVIVFDWDLVPDS